MMTDMEKVIKGLERCKLYNKLNCDKCPYDYNGRGNGKSECTAELATDALVLLKEQEPILLENQHKPYGDFLNANAPWVSRCPKCGKKIEGRQTRFCKYCGQAVKWDE